LYPELFLNLEAAKIQSRRIEGAQDYSLPIFALSSLNHSKPMQIKAGFVYRLLEFVGYKHCKDSFVEEKQG
jgi:hypothetical protein